jgi:hypothetical protein
VGFPGIGFRSLGVDEWPRPRLSQADTRMNYNALAGLVIGIFVIIAVIRGNGEALIAQIAQEKGFLVWGGALLIVYLLWDKGGTVGKYLGGIAGFLLLANIVKKMNEGT